MTLVVEDGTGVVGANSYVSVSYANSYFSTRGVTTWTGTDSAKESLLIKAFDWLEQQSYLGTRFYPDVQTSSFPRQGIYIDNVEQAPIPEKLKYAQCELALNAKSGSLYATIDPTSNATVGLVKRYRKETLGVQGAGIKSEIEYMDGAGGYLGVKVFPQVNNLLKGLTTSSSGVRVYR